MSNLVRINGKAFDHSSTVITIAGRKLTQVKDVKYDHKRNRGKVHGNDKSQVPVARTRGNYEAGSLVITTTSHEAQMTRDHLASLSNDGKSYGDPEVPIVVQSIEAPLPAQIDEFRKACMETDTGGSSYGPDANMVDMTFSFTQLLRNGKTLSSSKI